MLRILLHVQLALLVNTWKVLDWTLLPTRFQGLAWQYYLLGLVIWLGHDVLLKALWRYFSDLGWKLLLTSFTEGSVGVKFYNFLIGFAMKNLLIYALMLLMLLYSKLLLKQTILRWFCHPCAPVKRYIFWQQRRSHKLGLVVFVWLSPLHLFTELFKLLKLKYLLSLLLGQDRSTDKPVFCWF